jgi:hypothetical protein
MKHQVFSVRHGVIQIMDWTHKLIQKFETNLLSLEHNTKLTPAINTYTAAHDVQLSAT